MRRALPATGNTVMNKTDEVPAPTEFMRWWQSPRQPMAPGGEFHKEAACPCP